MMEDLIEIFPIQSFYFSTTISPKKIPHFFSSKIRFFLLERFKEILEDLCHFILISNDLSNI